MASSAPLGANDIEAALTVSPQSAATSSQIAFHSPEDLNQIFDAVDSGTFALCVIFALLILLFSCR
jgi:hypothetical protein